MNNNQHIKYPLGSDSVELMRAEVVAVDFKDDNTQNQYAILARPLSMMGGNAPKDLIMARPLDVNIKRIPVLHEVVLILKGPSAYSSALNIQAQSYYINSFSIQNNIHQNSLPKLSEVVSTNKSTDVGFPQKEEQEHQFGETFKEDVVVNGMQPYAGDLLIEGRFGQSIRMSSTTADSKLYTQNPLWKKANGKDNDPITILANGRLKPLDFGKFITENTSNDLSSIYLTSTQALQVKPKTSKFGAITKQEIDTFNKGKYKFAGSQIGIMSKGRVIINTDEQEIIMLSGGGFGVSSNKSICFDTSAEFEIGNTKRINLGLDANEPAILGDTAGEWLSELLTNLQTLCTQLASEIHPTGVGPSGPPTNATEYARLQSEFQKLQQNIPTLKSKLVFLNKNANTNTGALEFSEIERMRNDIEAADKAIADPSVPSSGKTTHSERKAYAQEAIQNGKEVTGEDTSAPPPPDPDKVCPSGATIATSASKYIGVREYRALNSSGTKHIDSNSGGALGNVPKEYKPGLIDNWLKNAGLNNRAKILANGRVGVEGYPWCAAFVNAVWSEAGLPTPKNDMGAATSCFVHWQAWAQQKGYWFSEPKVGAAVVFNFSHIGIVESVNGNTIYCIEGNTSNGKAKSVSEDRNGGGVYRKKRNISLVRGFVYPPDCV